jgi:hypothetical protein
VAPPPLGVAQVPSPRQKVLDEALVPLFICEVEMFPDKSVNAGWAPEIAPLALIEMAKLCGLSELPDSRLKPPLPLPSSTLVPDVAGA